jgi:glycosyltransferase involved in cell wall biosynthesis
MTLRIVTEGSRESTENLKVAIVGPPLSVLFGGQEVQADALVSHWQRDPDVSATFVASRPAFPKALAPVNRVPYLRTLARFPMYVGKLLHAVGKVDLVHVFAGSFNTFLLATAPAFVVARLLNKKVIIHYHSGRGNEHLGRSALARRILRACNLVVVPSEYWAAAFRAHGVASRVVANVVDPNGFPYRARNPVQPKLLCTRNLEAHYGIDVVVRAFARVQREFPEASLRLVGSGRQESEVRRLVGELALKHVQFMGAVHPEGMPAIYDESDIFVNGSYIDCAPVSILEAFCSGLPVVTTAAGGIPCLVQHEHTGLLSAPGDWEALAQSVLRLLRDPNLAKSMAETARQQGQLHSWTNLRTMWLGAYQETRPRRATQSFALGSDIRPWQGGPAREERFSSD